MARKKNKSKQAVKSDKGESSVEPNLNQTPTNQSISSSTAAAAKSSSVSEEYEVVFNSHRIGMGIGKAPITEEPIVSSPPPGKDLPKEGDVIVAVNGERTALNQGVEENGGSSAKKTAYDKVIGLIQAGGLPMTITFRNSSTPKAEAVAPLDEPIDEFTDTGVNPTTDTTDARMSTATDDKKTSHSDNSLNTSKIVSEKKEEGEASVVETNSEEASKKKRNRRGKNSKLKKKASLKKQIDEAEEDLENDAEVEEEDTEKDQIDSKKVEMDEIATNMDNTKDDVDTKIVKEDTVETSENQVDAQTHSQFKEQAKKTKMYQQIKIKPPHHAPPTHRNTSDMQSSKSSIMPSSEDDNLLPLPIPPSHKLQVQSSSSSSEVDLDDYEGDDNLTEECETVDHEDSDHGADPDEKVYLLSGAKIHPPKDLLESDSEDEDEITDKYSNSQTKQSPQMSLSFGARVRQPTELLVDSDDGEEEEEEEEEEEDNEENDDDYEEEFEDDYEDEEEEATGFLTQNQIDHVVRRNSQPAGYSASSSSSSSSSSESDESGKEEDDEFEYDESAYSAREKREFYSVALIVIKKLLEGGVIEPHHGGALKELLFTNDKRMMKPIAHYMETEDIAALFQAFRSVGLDSSLLA